MNKGKKYSKHKKRILTTYFTIVVLLNCSIVSFGQNGKFEFALNYNYTTNAKLFLFPFNADPVLRNQYLQLRDIFSLSVNARRKILGGLGLEANVEEISKTGKDKSVVISQAGGVRQIEVTDGFRAYLVELNLIYELPFSSERFKIYMGGGAGTYFGSHIRKFSGASVKSKNKNISVGIETLAGVEYYFYKAFALRFEMRFREPELKLHSEYLNKTIEYEGQQAEILNDSFDSNVDIDGAVFTFGLAYNF